LFSQTYINAEGKNYHPLFYYLSKPFTLLAVVTQELLREQFPSKVHIGRNMAALRNGRQIYRADHDPKNTLNIQIVTWRVVSEIVQL